MPIIDDKFQAALNASLNWRPSREDLENQARELAVINGRAWTDCGAYERELYMDEARRLAGMR